MTRTSCSVCAITALLVMPATAAALPTFPGAEGSAAEAIGGRGGAIYIVDTLSDNPADGVTLREAVEASGPRIIVFAVSGWIDLDSPLNIDNPNLTIAGQSSPGGVGVRGQTVLIETPEVVVMHMRFATGSLGGDGFDSLRIWGPGADNVMIDHSSIRWGCDESGETAFNPLRVTISWSVIGPGLYNCTDESNHNLGFLVWGGNDTLITFHHNFFPHNRYRNPEVNGGMGNVDVPTVDMVNNVGFDSFGGYTGILTYAGASRLNVIHNWFKLGSQNNSDAREGVMLGGESANGDGSYYVVGNAGAWRSSWDDASPGHGDWDSLKTEWNGATPHVSWMRSTPHTFPGIPVTQTNITEAYASTIVAESGATRPVIDSADATYKSDYEGGVQSFLDGNVIGATADSYPTLDGPAPPADTDADGMADEWESDRGLVVGADDSAADDDNDGYTNIEEYLHVLGGYAAGNIPGEGGGGAGGGGAGAGATGSGSGSPNGGGGSPHNGSTSGGEGDGDSDGDGCGCRAARMSDGVGISGALLMALLALRRRRRR